MQLIRKVDWFDGTGRAGQQSSLVCEGVHVQVDIYAFQGGFNNNIEGSVKKPCLFLRWSSTQKTQATQNFQNAFQINLLLPLTTTLLQISGKQLWWLYLKVCKTVLIFIWASEIGHFNEMLFVTPSCWRADEAPLMMIHFMSCVFITVGFASVLQPDSCWAAVLRVYTLFSLFCIKQKHLSFFVYQASHQPSVNLTLNLFYLWHLVVHVKYSCEIFHSGTLYYGAQFFINYSLLTVLY